LLSASLPSRRSPIWRLLGVSLIAVIGSVIATASASGTTVLYPSGAIPPGSVLQIHGQPNEVNDTTVSFDPASKKYKIVEHKGGFLFWTPECSGNVVSATAECPGDAVTKVEVLLGDGDDDLTLDSSVSVPTLVLGGPGNDTVSGGSGPDEITGEAGVDRLTGGEGNDILRNDGRTGDPSESHDDGTLSGGPGNDFFYGTDGNDVIDGGGGDDEILAYGGDDAISGGDGNDVLNGGDGADTMAGGAGNDTMGTSVTQAPGNVSLERGNDSMDGGPGDDALHPGAGPPDPCPPNAAPPDCSDDDVLRGGDGYDTVSYERRTHPVRVSIDGIADDGQSGESDNVEPDVEQIIGGAGDDTLIGSRLEDAIDGRGGDDLIDGLGGSDFLEGGAVDGGSDHLEGGSGNDTLSGSAGDDLLDGQDGADSLIAGEGADVLYGGNANDRLSGGGGSDTLRGGPADDDLDGGPGADVLEGDDGNDTLRGSAGDDVLRGGQGADEMFGGDGTDEAQYELSAQVTVTLDDRPDDGSKGERDNVRSDVERVLGGADQDTLFGNTRDNTLDGAAGQDYLDGRPGPDNLLGGGARDVVRARDGSPDTVDCGRSVDLAIVDPMDTVKNCERKSDGVHDQPQQGADIIVDPVQGENTLQLPGMDRTVPLVTKEDRVEVPVGSSVDASDQGSVTVTSEAGGGESQAGQFEDGRFQIDQQRDDSVTNVRLVGGEPCKARGTGHARSSAQGGKSRRARQGRHGKGKIPPGAYGSSAAVTSRRGGRRGGPSGRSRFRMIGVFSSATGIGPASGAGSARRSRKSANSHTEWITTDRCDGTFTRVVSGEVKVRDFSRGRTISLGAGDSYLARPSG
jgi:Ca2+-binding RTX toxin-like protein